MEYRRLGSSGLVVSRLIVGGQHFGGPEVDEGRARELVKAAWDVGVNTFYTADRYSDGNAERVLGASLKPRRDDMVLMVKTGYRVGSGDAPLSIAERQATHGTSSEIDHQALWKLGVTPNSRGLSRKHILSGVEQSLRRLQTDYIDVYIAHFWDPRVPVEETLAAMDSLVKQGKVRYIGCSQTSAWQLYRTLWISELKGLARYESVQTRFNVLQRDALRDLVPAAQAAGVSVLSYGSLAGGVLADFDRFATSPPAAVDHDLVASLRRFAEESGRSLGELGQAWVLAHEAITALQIGPYDPGQLAPQSRAVANPLSTDEFDAVERLLRA
jgi:1-deoxyxylulose-5-phosphate synthase